ncbi:MAG: hypothetical protein LBG06_10860, partial [Deltaproteobacteria bacterium]|nr:hypothetical protein [Deltaproteobacteria bacterium]
GRLEARGDTRGLLKIALNDDETAPRSRDPFIREAFDSPGCVVRERITLPDGTGRRQSSKLVFSFPNDPDLTLEMRQAFSQMRDRSRALALMAGANRWPGQFHTQPRLMFPAVSAARDLGERLLTTYGRGDCRRADGTPVDSREAAAAMTRIVMDPGFLGAYASIQIRKRVPDNDYGRYWREFESSGANFAWISLLKDLNRKARVAAGGQAMGTVRSAARRALGPVPDAWRKADAAVGAWGDAFNIAPLLAQFAALRESGVDVQAAAAAALGSMNCFKRGRMSRSGRRYSCSSAPRSWGGEPPAADEPVHEAR